MRKAYQLFPLLFLGLMIGCAKPSGGGSTSVGGHEVCYGIGETGVAFVLFTDVPSGSTKGGTSAKSGVTSSKISGFVEGASGERIDYAADGEKIAIAGKTHTLSQGKVFLVSVLDGDVTVEQLNVAIEPTTLSSDAMKEEIQRIAKEPDVAAFLEKTPDNEE